jgi:hypothetical protein
LEKREEQILPGIEGGGGGREGGEITQTIYAHMNIRIGKKSLAYL